MVLITHALCCDPQVQRLVPMDNLHAHTVDDLEELKVQLPFISGAYCADTSQVFSLWKSLGALDVQSYG